MKKKKQSQESHYTRDTIHVQHDTKHTTLCVCVSRNRASACTQTRTHSHSKIKTVLVHISFAVICLSVTEKFQI